MFSSSPPFCLLHQLRVRCMRLFGIFVNTVSGHRPRHYRSLHKRGKDRYRCLRSMNTQHGGSTSQGHQHRGTHDRVHCRSHSNTHILRFRYHVHGNLGERVVSPCPTRRRHGMGRSRFRHSSHT